MSTPTREDYDLAAKAAGFADVHFKDGLAMREADWNTDYSVEWNPYNDDGDSRRLQIAIMARLTPCSWYASAITYGKELPKRKDASYADHNNDKGAAARAAVFWLAVEIGRSMGNPAAPNAGNSHP